MRSARSDLEQSILNCWNVTKDIELVTKYILDGPLESSREDKIANLLIGIKELYELKFDECFLNFEKLMKEQQENNTVDT